MKGAIATFLAATTSSQESDSRSCKVSYPVNWLNAPTTKVNWLYAPATKVKTGICIYPKGSAHLPYPTPPHPT